MTTLFDTQGIARSITLLRTGWTRHSIAKAVDSGQLIRPRKGWVARPTCDPQLLFAARSGLLISCATQAKRLGLWSNEDRQHFAVRHRGAQSRPAGAVLHWRAPIVPRHPDALLDAIENVLDTVAHCLPVEEAIAVWDSALNKDLIDYPRLARLPFTGVAKRVLAGASRFADSGLESYVRQRLAWLRLRIVPQAWVLGHRVDFLIGDRLVLQIDGSQHEGRQRRSDNGHDFELGQRGYEVIRVGYAEVVFDWPGVQLKIMQALALGRHKAA